MFSFLPVTFSPDRINGELPLLVHRGGCDVRLGAHDVCQHYPNSETAQASENANNGLKKGITAM
jgi:hypothetical protein